MNDNKVTYGSIEGLIKNLSGILEKDLVESRKNPLQLIQNSLPYKDMDKK